MSDVDKNVEDGSTKVLLTPCFVVLETSMGHGEIPDIKEYKKFADVTVRELNHGGIAVYLHKTIASSIFDITYNKCFISFRLNFAPHVIFIGAYIQPESSSYFSSTMFNDLSSFILSSIDKNLTPIMGGDINCRYGDMNHSFQNLGVRYNVNADPTINAHGRTYGTDLCKSSNIFPINHLVFGNRKFIGDFTYYKGEKKSQIDFVYTNRNGIKMIKSFSIISENWHISDHRPIGIEIVTPEVIQPAILLKRATELNYEFDPNRINPTRYLSSYDTRIFEECLRNKLGIY